MGYVVNRKNSDGVYVEYLEYRDFDVNYDTKTITFASAPAAGILEINYNPLWMRGLAPADFPLKCDLFEETFTTTTSQDYVLKSQPVDPLRVVTLDGTTLVEDVNYSLNVFTKTLHLLAAPTAGQSLVVKYTPFLADAGLAVGYRMTRTNTTNQAYVEPNSFTYRV
jgi:hypothetical protein